MFLFFSFLFVPVCFCRESQITPGKAEWSKNVQRFEAFEIAYLKICSTTHFAFGLNVWFLEHLLYISQVEFADFCRHNKSSPITQLLKLSFTATFSPPILRTATCRHFLLRKTCRKFSRIRANIKRQARQARTEEDVSSKLRSTVTASI